VESRRGNDLIEVAPEVPRTLANGQHAPVCVAIMAPQLSTSPKMNRFKVKINDKTKAWHHYRSSLGLAKDL
jgi:hypothetical protein